MNLSPEDSLRLNVLLNQELQAVRIDESRMVVHALTPAGEASVTLNPNCRDELYLKQVRELLSGHVLDSPGGYPVYIRRWTRTGQARDSDSLHSLLKLGEPEAVVAVVHAPGLTPALARLAWWAMPDADNARRMLAVPDVAGSDVGREMARYLIDYLPFETEPSAIFSTVRQVLQPGLVSDEVRDNLWKRAARKGTIYVGFLQAMPDALPSLLPPHPGHEHAIAALAGLLDQGNAAAELLCRVMSPAGQAFLDTVARAMDKLADEAATVAVFDAIGRYFRAVLPVGHPDALAGGRDSEAAVAFARTCLDDEGPWSAPLAELLEITPEHRAALQAMVALSFAGEALLDSFFSHSDAVGPLMRRKLKPWTEPMMAQIAVLRGQG